jgi:hypothetical protein
MKPYLKIAITAAAVLWLYNNNDTVRGWLLPRNAVTQPL